MSWTAHAFTLGLLSSLAYSTPSLAAAQLEPVFELIDESGGIEAFMSEGIGLDRADLAAIRETLKAQATHGDVFAYFKHEDEPTGALRAVDVLEGLREA